LPEGVTELAVDSIFMMPQLGVLAEVNDKAATDVFIHDCLVRLGSSVSVIGAGKEGQRCLKVRLTLPGGKTEEFEMPFGSMRRVILDVGEEAEAVLEPASGFDVGAGKGKELRAKLKGGIAGILFDARGRQPFVLPKEKQARIQKLGEWCDSLDVYPGTYTVAALATAGAGR
jgi:hypothetical protein